MLRQLSRDFLGVEELTYVIERIALVASMGCARVIGKF